MLGVSVIIPCYNAGKFLEEAVASVHASRPSVPYEILIVDDVSTDVETKAALETIAATDPKARVFSMAKNSGQAAARNYALEIAAYDVFLPLDADDKIAPTADGSYLDKAYKLLSKRPDVFTVTTNYHQFGALTGLCRLYPFEEPAHLIKTLMPAWSAFRRSEALEAGGYNPTLRFAEDWDFSVTVMNQRFIQGKPLHAAQAMGFNVFYRTHNTGLNASVKERHSRETSITAIMGRNPEIYDHYYPGRTPEELGSRTTLIKTAFSMAAHHPLDLARMAEPVLERRLHGILHRQPR